MNRKPILPGLALLAVLVFGPALYGAGEEAAVHAAGEEAVAVAGAKTDAVPTVEAAIAELTGAYSKLEGYIASYHTEGKNSSLD